ncbi:glycine betaine ABC transporter substrate-binding protein [Enteractinococcus fodinae]|uniref:Glycine betaine/proline transport system substrate-binding protein n=1 Tax=Enteractinococcus fodinae TaxID=684663 RepID=A0ABU2B4S4_9MICC|nr:glycine betaine ABC transporter substrate-binding protein [Enteractinococcus fodinae]MDR7347793.1 glycine betaine/proline transport system substrate-binding protein [Enteractinococcus fodinae]
MTFKSRFFKSAAALSVAALALTACGNGGEDTGNGNGNGDSAAEGNGGEVTIGVFNGWEEGIAVSELWAYVLEEEGYDVSLEYADPAPVYSGLSTNDYNVTLDAWLPITHADYVEEYEADIQDLGAWNEEASLHIAVNEDAPIDSLDELAENADEFNNEIVGIDPGAGLVQTTENEVIPTYGLEDMEFTTSSTPAMLQELDSALEAGENIAVTLWRPHWAYDAFPIKDLEDPEGALGGAESMHTFANAEWAQDEANSELVGWFEGFEMDSDTLYSLENVMFNENEDVDDYRPIIEEWAAENQEYVDGLTN